MTFDARELSIADGQPIRLYQFVRGTMQWLYCSADRDVVQLTRTYQALRGGIKDDGISQNGEISTQNVRITAPGDIEVAQLFRGIPPSDSIDVVLYDRHFGESEYRVSWVGEILGVGWPQADRCVITCSPESISMESAGLRLCWERQCPHCIYERGCNVDRELYRVEGDIIASDGASIDISAASSYPDAYFQAGYVEWPIAPGVYERRAIEVHESTNLLLFGGSSGIPLGASVALFPGCDQTAQTCNDRFNNLPNQGGISHLAGRSPFDGNPVF